MARFLGNNFCPTNPHFFKIIQQKTLQINKLQIPKKIVRKCGSTLTDQVLLKLPCGLEWKIGLSRSSDGKVWIQKGWPELSKHYSIALDQLLVLRYEGNSQFSVLIFDSSSSVEINYPTLQVKEETKEHENSDASSSPCLKRRDISPLPCPQLLKRMRTSPALDQITTRNRQSRNLSSKGYKLDLVDKDVDDGNRKSNTLSRLSAEEKAKALKRTSGFKSEHPFFVLPMQPSYVTTKFYVNVPLEFAQKFVGTCKNVTLQDQNGRTWPMKYKLREYNGKARTTLESGWKAFALGNNLKRGDVCVFELTKCIESVSFEVSILRCKEARDSALLPVHKPTEFKDGPVKSRPRKVESVQMHVDLTESSSQQAIPSQPTPEIYNVLSQVLATLQEVRRNNAGLRNQMPTISSELVATSASASHQGQTSASHQGQIAASHDQTPALQGQPSVPQSQPHLQQQIQPESKPEHTPRAPTLRQLRVAHRRRTRGSQQQTRSSQHPAHSDADDVNLGD